MVDHLVPEIIHTVLQLLDHHFVLDQEHLSDLVALVRQELQECAHQWAPDLHPSQVMVRHHLHVLPAAVTHLQLVRLIEVALQQLLDRVVPVPVVQAAVPVQVVQAAVPVVDVQVAKRADQDKDRSQRKLVAKRLIIYAHHHLVALLFRTEMEALR